MGRLHAFLARPVAGFAVRRDGDATHADAIFVFAGNQERKVLAVERWRAGVATRMIVSVGRFEWRRYPQLGLPDGGLQSLVQATPYWRRHFFVLVDHDRAEARFVGTQPFGTRHEARALVATARERNLRTIVIVTSGVHVRRASIALARAARGLNLSFTFETLPDLRDPYGPTRWRHTRAGVRAVLLEVVKVAIYATLLWR